MINDHLKKAKSSQSGNLVFGPGIDGFVPLPLSWPTAGRTFARQPLLGRRPAPIVEIAPNRTAWM